MLGTDDHQLKDVMLLPPHGVFSESALEHVQLPSTLKRIEYAAFCDCKSLKSIELPENLEKIGIGAFSKSELNNIEFPASLRVISQAAFARCKSLKTVKFNEGLETLGTGEYTADAEEYYGAFEASAIEHAELPSILKRIGYWAFKECMNLKNSKLPNA